MYVFIFIYICYVLLRGKVVYGFYMFRFLIEFLISDSCFKVRNIFKIYIYDYDFLKMKKFELYWKKCIKKCIKLDLEFFFEKLKIIEDKFLLLWSKCL